MASSFCSAIARLVGRFNCAPGGQFASLERMVVIHFRNETIVQLALIERRFGR
jgi:hypothetical protein